MRLCVPLQAFSRSHFCASSLLLYSRVIGFWSLFSLSALSHFLSAYPNVYTVSCTIFLTFIATRSFHFRRYGTLAAAKSTPVARCHEGEKGPSEDHHKGCHRQFDRKGYSQASDIYSVFKTFDIPKAIRKRDISNRKHPSQIKHASLDTFKTCKPRTLRASK